MFEFRIWNIIFKKMLSWGDVFHLPAWEIFPGTPEQRAYNVMRFTGKCDISGKKVYEGDIIESHLGGQIIAGNMEIKYGTYQAYCPADKCYMDSVGFYAVARGYPDMPIGPLEDYAKVIGNIFENPELLSEAGQEAGMSALRPVTE